MPNVHSSAVVELVRLHIFVSSCAVSAYDRSDSLIKSLQRADEDAECRYKNESEA